MTIAKPPEPYILLDSGNLKKLEQVGPFRLVRPALNAFWRPALPDAEWQKADAVLERDSRGNGHWDFKRELPEIWNVSYAGFILRIKPTAFGHLGFFAEQHANWAEFEKCGKIKALNLFAYSGIGSMAMAKGGAQVTHLDAARGMVEWAQENRRLNPDVPDAIRWIVDDVTQFCRREVRRGAKYNLIALDPPSFGRGSKAQVWKIEDDLIKLLELCCGLKEDGKPFTIALSAHSPGFSGLVMSNMLTDVFGRGECRSFEMTVADSTGRLNPSGICAIFSTR
ncbi:MAG: class I SAM-dependent methyltransferase [Victivallaceae bacterium]|nr:class I SAM-dependent methyltransferase [Victivallaceae bacterium]